MQIGPLIGRGRDAEIFALDNGHVLRRARDGRSLAGEAAVMAHARAGGVPVPAVHDVTPDGAIVMDRVDGRTLLDTLLRRPWRIGFAAGVLADLHDALHRLQAPPEAESCGLAGDRLLHLDLHPMNVLMTSSGPVLVDWANARSGPAAADVAMSWVLLTTAGLDASPPVRFTTGVLRSRLTAAFLERVEAEAAARALPAVAKMRMADPTVHAAESARIRALVARHGRAAGPAYPT